MTEKPTQQQLDELKRLSKEARVPDESEIVTSKQEIPVSRRPKRACAEAILDWLATAREPSAAGGRTTQKTAI